MSFQRTGESFILIARYLGFKSQAVSIYHLDTDVGSLTSHVYHVWGTLLTVSEVLSVSICKLLKMLCPVFSCSFWSLFT